MRRKLTFLTLTIAAFALSATAQTTPAQNPASSSQSATMGSASAATTINATLDKSIDAKKAKAGDQVEARTSTDARLGTVMIPRGTKLMGHVTDAKAHEKGGAPSSLAIQFDRAVVKGGQEVALHGVIQAISAPQPAGPIGSPDISAGNNQGAYGQGGGYGSMGGAAPRGGMSTPQAPSTVSPPVDAGGNAGPANPSGQIGAGATGVVGMKDLKLEPVGNDSAQGSTITSDNKNVKLDSGTQMVLRVTAQ